MWKRCRSVFDEAVKILVWEWEEAILGVLLFAVGQFLIGPLWSTALAAVVLWFIYRTKKGKPAGAVVHWLHRVDFPFFRLPGVLPAASHTYGPWK